MDWSELFVSLFVGSWLAFFSLGFIGVMADVHKDGQSRTLKGWLEYLIYITSYPFYVFAHFMEDDYEEYLHKKYVEKKRFIFNKKYILWFLLWYIYCYLAFTGTLPMWLRFF